MRLPLSAILITILLAVQPSAAAPDEVDFVLTFHEDGSWTYDGPIGMLTATSEEPGERYVWDLRNPGGPAIGEVRYLLDTFDIERAKQLRPSVDPGQGGFPLFHYFPRPAVWETDGPAQVYHVFQEGDHEVLRLQILATADGTFTLERDVTPPNLTLGEVERVTHHSFYQETRTNELAIVDLQVRAAGSTGEWVRNPTPDFHVLQKFPIQGLDPDTRYDVRAVATDWSNNTNNDTYSVRTLPREHGAPPDFEVLSPEPDARLPSGSEVTVRVRILDGDTALDPSMVRLFIDLQEQSDFLLEDRVLTYTYDEPPADGPHVASVEAKSLDGAEGHVRWTFHVGEESRASPTPGVLLALGSVALVALAARGRRRS